MHSYTETVTKEPTCTEAGEKTYTCDCGDSYTEEIPATGHHYENGECTNCGEKDPNYHTHSYTETVTKEPTCTEAGEKTYTCDCGDSYIEEIPATGHHYGEDDKCTDCGELNPNHTHNYLESITKQATCIEEGEKAYTCEVCGDSYTQSIPKVEHTYVPKMINWEPVTTTTKYPFVQDGNKWTSSNKGVKTSTSSSSWSISVEEETELTIKYKVSSEKSYDKFTLKLDSTTIANTISGEGEELTYTTTLSKGLHTLIAQYTKDSSGDKYDDCAYVILEGFISDAVHVCSICNNEQPHNYVETIVKEATCTEDGSKDIHCVCGITKHETIPALGHDMPDNSEVCTRCGLTCSHNWSNGECSICGKKCEHEYLNGDVEWEVVQPTNVAYHFINSSGNRYTSNNTASNITQPARTDWKTTPKNDTKIDIKYGRNAKNGGYITLLLNNEKLGSLISVANASDIITLDLKAGVEYTLTATYNRNGTGSTTTGTNGYVEVPSAPTTHFCKKCGNSEAHKYSTVTDRCEVCGSLNPNHKHTFEDGYCTKCGDKDPDWHEHILVEQTKQMEWECYYNGTYKFVQSGNTWTSNNSRKDSTTAASSWKVLVSDETEYTFGYRVSSDNYDKLYISVDGKQVVSGVYGNGSYTQKTITLSPGTVHNIHASFSKDSSGWNNSDNAYIVLPPIQSSNHKCIVCNEESNHVFKEIVTTFPTCTETGVKSWLCDCGKVSKTEILLETGHRYDSKDHCIYCDELNPEHVHDYKAESTVLATCSEKGEITYTCYCGDKYKEEIDSLGHIYVDGTCIRCGLPSGCLSHDFVDGVCTKCGELENHTHIFEEVGENINWVQTGRDYRTFKLSTDNKYVAQKYKGYDT